MTAGGAPTSGPDPSDQRSCAITSVPMPLQPRRVGHAADAEDDVLGACLGEPGEALDDRIGLLLVGVHRGEHGPFDLLVGTAEPLAVLAQHLELGANELR